MSVKLCSYYPTISSLETGGVGCPFPTEVDPLTIAGIEDIKKYQNYNSSGKPTEELVSLALEKIVIRKIKLDKNINSIDFHSVILLLFTNSFYNEK